MRADALEQWIVSLYGSEVSVTRWQALESGHWLDRFGVSLYNCIQRSVPRLHHVYFNFLEKAGLHRRASQLRGQAAYIDLLEREQPEVIVSTHAHLNHGFFELAKQRLGHSVRCLTYCGELSGGYGFSRHWINASADGFIAAVDACADAALQLGMPAAKIYLGGFLLRPAFYCFESDESSEAESLRKSLMGDFDDGRPLILLGTGANGANNHVSIIRGLRNASTPLAIVALCGHNEAIFQELTVMNERLERHRIIPLMYRSDMAAILRAVDLAFVRPGTGTTSECIVCGCPVVFNGIGGVMPQERITVKYLQALGVPAPLVGRPAQLASIVDQLLAEGDSGICGQQKKAFKQINSGLSPAGIVRETLK